MMKEADNILEFIKNFNKQAIKQKVKLCYNIKYSSCL